MNSSTKAAPMTKEETMLLVQLVSGNKIIFNKATNAVNNKMKDLAWQNLVNEFNSSVSSLPRTASQLRLKWENLKKTARKRSAKMRCSLFKTGGKDHFPPDEVLDSVQSLLDNTCQDFTIEFGEDSVPTSVQNTISTSVQNTISTMCGGSLNGTDGQDVSFSDCGGRVCEAKEQDVKPVEKPSPTEKNLFLNRASGSSTLEKRKLKMEEDKSKARIARDNALTEYLISKKKKIDLEIDEKHILIAKLKLELENVILENKKSKMDLNLLE